MTRETALPKELPLGRLGPSLPALFALLGYLTLAYVALPAPLEWDEKRFYLPALQQFARSWPSVPESYRLPLPPLGLWIYGTIYRATGGSTLALRLASTAFAGATLLLVRRHARASRAPRESVWWFGLLVCQTTMMSSAFIFKANAWAVLLTSGAMLIRASEAATRSTAWTRVGPSVALTLAVLSHQMAAAAALFDFLRGLAPTGNGRRTSTVTILVRAVPLLTLGGLFAAWGGFQPPDYRTALRESQVGGLQFRPEQLAVGLLVVGAWTTPWLGLTKRSGSLAAASYVPCALLIQQSGLLTGSDWSGSFLCGPLRDLLDRLSRGSPEVAGWLAAAPAALGCGLVMDGLLRGGWRRAWALYYIVYAVMMNAVPYAYEQYYLLLLVPGMALLRDEIHEPPPIPLLALRWLTLAFGVVMAIRTFL